VARRAAAPGRPSLIDFASPSVEVMRALRLALVLRSPSDAGSRVLVTSAEPGAGKSTIAANLAVVSALGGSRVLLVDADLPKPVQHSIFGLPRGPGLVDYLASGGDLDTFVQSGPAKLDILTIGREVSRMAEILSSPRMTELFETAADRYDALIVDTAPVLASADAAAIATSAGLEVLFVVTRTTRRHDVTRALRRLELVRAPIAGLVLNREGQQDTYGYGI
jgi:capsular exopolysaccharide synthesis family protein